MSRGHAAVFCSKGCLHRAALTHPGHHPIGSGLCRLHALRCTPARFDELFDFLVGGDSGAGDVADFIDEISLSAIDRCDLGLFHFHLKSRGKCGAQDVGHGLFRIFEHAAVGERRSGVRQLKIQIVGNFGERSTVAQLLLNLGSEIGEAANALFFAKRVGDFSADIGKGAGRGGIHRIDACNVPAKRTAGGRCHRAICRGEICCGNGGRGLRGQSTACDVHHRRRAQTRFPCDLFEGCAASNAVANRLCRRFGGYDQLREVPRFACGILFGVALVAGCDLGLGRFDAVAQGIRIERGVADYAALGADESFPVGVVIST